MNDAHLFPGFDKKPELYATNDGRVALFIGSSYAYMPQESAVSMAKYILSLVEGNTAVTDAPTHFDSFRTNVELWAKDRGILDHATTSSQVLKATSEMGELADAALKQDRRAFMDAVGDVVMCLVNACAIEGVSFDACCWTAWNEIKDRTGRMTSTGTFIKD